MKQGYSLSEILVVVAIVSVLALISMATFVGQRNKTHLNSTTSSMAALLREAQSNSFAQASSTSWGVHFDNSAETPFFSLFSGSYSSSSHNGYYALPAWVGYATSSIGLGSYAEVSFAQISGLASGSSSISLFLYSNPNISSTIYISGAGAVTY